MGVEIHDESPRRFFTEVMIQSRFMITLQSAPSPPSAVAAPSGDSQPDDHDQIRRPRGPWKSELIGRECRNVAEE